MGSSIERAHHDKIQFILNYTNQRFGGRLQSVLTNKPKASEEMPWSLAASEDYYGLWEGKSIKFKKLQTILIYRYIYRFSVEKLTNMVDDKFLMLMMV
mmetsp:Transcript_23984/g.36816  ORF Transcript_23984/g.36816 Transcript_23984/m.36816 type:complete len:98 (-) Transcript_23984:428-721(-)